ncbi:STY4528 family pathogenicity island replication protein [Pseudomonas sp. CCI3.2]|uniref:STY4528 family pathogenicity island replication protein n=1 Tax=unclassified Pseudomonas TaxID=196821 RepID=UPI002AC8C49A|nr:MULTISPECIES: STY4528 family pathogenicity island replication protein [unclassified Pseudomonas]MEB0080010.1 STY4528 family pathogenicity island replication protein [Pseudomonas sp. MH10out]MEB0093838.1 STY4528 family pathogenicity island replication protein [Pseudomonas sp. CCI4.2]MEB0103641.1 STY4528 family pathogenicity island replication protein [Pseudomonas sp. CCI3.2]MEB0132933.1 STY4528 family pathogenicity island replication protein [Pseudomonas sp. CCI2.4]MEB0160069.1 STY4528 famil
MPHASKRFTPGNLDTLNALLASASSSMSDQRREQTRIPKPDRPGAQPLAPILDTENTGNPHEAFPRRLLLDNRLTPLERNAWQVFRLLLNDDGLTSFPTYEQLRPYLASSPYKLASRETVAKALTALRLTRWLSLAGRVRDEVTGQMKGNIYLLHDEPISISEAMLLDSSYLQLVGNSQDHANKSIRQVAANTLEEFMQDPHLREQTLPSHLEVLGRRVANQGWAKALNDKSNTQTPPSDAPLQSELGPSESELSQSESELSKKHPVRNRAAPRSESEPSGKQGSAPRVRNPNSSSTSTNTNTSVCKSSVPRASPGAVIKWPASFENLAPDQRRKVQVGLGWVSAEVQQSVLDQWDVRVGQGQIRNPFGYLLGMIEKARNGEFNVVGQVGMGRSHSDTSGVAVADDGLRDPLPAFKQHQPTELSKSVANKELAAIMAMMGKRGVGAVGSQPVVGGSG